MMKGEVFCLTSYNIFSFLHLAMGVLLPYSGMENNCLMGHNKESLLIELKMFGEVSWSSGYLFELLIS